jgi:hypothetical protein
MSALNWRRSFKVRKASTGAQRQTWLHRQQPEMPAAVIAGATITKIRAHWRGRADRFLTRQPKNTRRVEYAGRPITPS